MRRQLLAAAIGFSASLGATLLQERALERLTKAEARMAPATEGEDEPSTMDACRAAGGFVTFNLDDDLTPDERAPWRCARPMGAKE